MEPRRSTGWPILLGVVLIGSILALGVGWVLVSIAAAFGSGNAAFYWVILGVGVALLVLLLIGVIVYLFLTVKAIALSQRQSNFIDSVTHELKSPLASLKLYLQTLTRRQVSPEQQADFHRFMLKDVERLDTLIDHLLDAAKTQKRPRGDEEACDLEPILRAARDGVAIRYGVDAGRIRILPLPEGAVAWVRGRSADLEIVFRNLVDNAVKYSMPEPEVEVCVDGHSGRNLVVRVVDNGPGIPPADRMQVFGRFVRLGSELERSTPGTGLGLYLVKSIVAQLRGKVTASGRAGRRGTVMEVRLPAAETPPKARAYPQPPRDATPDPFPTGPGPV
jgi:signal transduction histidine kinase